MKVLLVDDCADSLVALDCLFRQGGHECEKSFGGAGAINAATQLPFDIAILDYLINDMNGLDVLRALRQAGVGVPAMIVTGVADHVLEDIESRIASERLGPAAVVGKPYDPLALLRAVEAMAGYRSPASKVTVTSTRTDEITLEAR